MKIRGRGGSGEPNTPAIRPQTRLHGAPDFTRGGAARGDPGCAAAGEAGPSGGEAVFGQTFGSAGHTRGARWPRGLAPLGSLRVDVQVLGFWAWVSGGPGGSPHPRPPPIHPDPKS